MLLEYILFLGTAIGLIATLLYIKNIIYGSTRPNVVSWFIWMIAPLIGVFFELKAGAGLSVLPIFMAGFGPLLVIIVSLFSKKFFWKITKLDIVCGILALAALALYVLTHNLSISILFAILSDGLAAIPTLYKSWRFPETETAAPYATGILNNILGLLIIKKWIFSIYSFNIYFILINIAIVFCIYRKKIFKS